MQVAERPTEHAYKEVQSEKALGTFRLGFIMEYLIGHVTFQKNLQEYVETDPQVEANWFKLEFEPRGLERYLPIVRQNWSLRAALKGRRILNSKGNSFDGLFFHAGLPALLSVPYMRRIPSLISLDATPVNIDELDVFYAHAHGNDLLHRISHLISRRTYHAASVLVPWSNWTKRSLIQDYGIPEEKVQVIPGGINPKMWTPKDHQEKAEPLKILFVGGDFERKGGNLLLDCFGEHLCDRFQLDIITKDKLKPTRGIFVHNNITPNSEALRRLFSNADIFILPTLGDASPWVVLEAMASGLPVISTKVGAIPEMVEERETGILIPTRDGRALREAIEAIASSQATRAMMGARGRQVVEERFDAEKNGRAMVNLLKRAIANTRHLELSEDLAGAEVVAVV